MRIRGNGFYWIIGFVSPNWRNSEKEVNGVMIGASVMGGKPKRSFLGVQAPWHSPKWSAAETEISRALGATAKTEILEGLYAEVPPVNRDLGLGGGGGLRVSGKHEKSPLSSSREAARGHHVYPNVGDITDES